MMKRMMVIQNQREVKVKSHPVPKKAVRAKIKISNHRITLRKNDNFIRLINI
jgi:hypothetical protein